MIDHVKEDYGLPLQIRVIVDDLLENDPDLKPNELLRIINKNRSKYVKLEKELSTQLQNDSNYIPTQRQKKINGAYLFDKKIIPDLSKVTHFFSILINNSLYIYIYINTLYIHRFKHTCTIEQLEIAKIV